jgi:hypothetical protein
MKLCAVAIFCVFLGIAFSQDSSFVSLPQDSVVEKTLDTTSIDTASSAISIDPAFNALFIDTASADSAKIKPGLHFFVSAGLQFINFKEGSRFQALLNAEYEKYDYPPLRQDFETVNLAFPISAGIIWQFSDVHSLGLGVIFLYDNESVVLTDKQGETHNFKYTLQSFPIFAEYRLLISPNLITLKNNDYFSLFLRYYWLLPHTDINSSWGNAKADFEPLGNGYGIFLGYRFWEWEGLSVSGEMGYLSLDAKSSTKNGILNSWNLGGITVLVRALF